MRQFRTLIACSALVALTFMLASCGDDTEALDPVSWPFLETTQKLSVNGKEFDAYIASTEQHRRRALNGIAIKEGQAIAYLFPEQKEPVKVRFINLPAAVDLIFVDANGKAVSVESVPAFSQGSFPHEYAGKNARVVLQVRKGVAKDLGISKGGEVKTDPNLIEKSKEAGGTFAKLFFLRTNREEEKPEDAPSVELKVLEKPEEVAQLVKDRDALKDGQGVILPINSQFHSFWMKEAVGTWCACYLESTGRFRSTVISSIYENITAGGGSDLDEPMYYSPTKATHLAIWKGSDFFKTNDIDRRSPVAVAGVDVMSAEAVTYDELELKFGDTRVDATLARTEDERKAALLKAKTLEKNKAIVLAWDDASFVKIDAPAGINLWYVKADGGKYSIGQKFVDTKAGDTGAAASSRFVLALPKGFEASGELTFPYALRDMKPGALPLIFYSAKTKEVVKDRWPGKDNNLKARVRMELAITDAEQTRGLMFRTSLRKNYGMLFVYQAEEPSLEYWMKNCKMNLSIAFCNDKGVIIKIHQVMKAPDAGTPDYQLERYESGGPAKFAIELEQKWFEENKVVEGDRIFIPPAMFETE